MTRGGSWEAFDGEAPRPRQGTRGFVRVARPGREAILSATALRLLTGISRIFCGISGLLSDTKVAAGRYNSV